MQEELPHWREATTFAHRLNWARRSLRDIEGGQRLPTKKDAAEYLGVKPGTYRTWEAPKEEGGREPPIQEIRRIARRLQVGWVWLAQGIGRPDENVLADDSVEALNQKIAQLPKEVRDQAVEAATGVVETFLRRIK